MSNLRRALNSFFETSSKLTESKALDRARTEFQANPEDENARANFTKLSGPAGYPDVHEAAVAFQSALHSTAKAGHSRGWQGGEDALQALVQAAETHGVDPGLFVTKEGAGSKREHILQLARVYGGKFLPGDGRSQMWEPQAHSFPDADSAQQFADMVNNYYPATGAQVEQGSMQTNQTGDDGQPIPVNAPTFTVRFTHKSLGRPYPSGTKEHAHDVASSRSKSAPGAHHVVVDQSGEHAVTLNPDQEAHQVIQTYYGGRAVGAKSMQNKNTEQQPEIPDQDQIDQDAEVGDAADAGQAESLDFVDRFLVESSYVLGKSRKRQTMTEHRSVELNNELASASQLYKKSNIKTFGGLNENIAVDANRDVSPQGNSPHDKFVSPATREKVLRAREDEISAFAASRSIPTSNVFAAVEAAMRTGKVPDLGQYGLAGDDAVATKQFIVSNVLNIQGMEWVDYKGDVVTSDPIEETHGLSKVATSSGVNVGPQMFMKFAKRRADRLPKMEDSASYKNAGAPESSSGSVDRVSSGNAESPVSRNMTPYDLLSSNVMSKLKKIVGPGVYGYTKQELVALAREHGLVGTDESIALSREMMKLIGRDHNKKTLGGADLSEDDYALAAVQMGGKYLGYVQPHQAIYEFPSEKSAIEFANKCAAKTKSTPHVDGKRVSVDEPKMSEAGHIGYAGHAGPMAGPSPHGLALGPDKKPFTKKDKKEDASEADKILGIDADDPRSAAWPLISDEMKRLLNIEDNRFMGPGVGFTPDKSPVEEATFGGMNVGAFLGGAMMNQLAQRAPQLPPYDTSVDLRDCDRQEKLKRLRELLKKVGVRNEEK